MSVGRRGALRLMVAGAALGVFEACTSAPAPTPGSVGGAASSASPQAAAVAASGSPEAATGALAAASPQPAVASVAVRPSPSAAATLPAAAPSPAAAAAAQNGISRNAADDSAGGQNLAARSGGTLRVGLPSDISSLDGHVLSVAATDTIWQLYDRLTELDDQLQPQPALAESWELAPDYTRIKLNLRRGVQYHSGREFTSDDVKFNVLRGRDPKIAGGAWVTQSSWWTSVETPDKYTAILSSDQPRPSMFDYFEYLGMLDQQSLSGPNAQTASVGTGAFSLVEWVQGDHLTFARNPNYWKTGRPYLDGVQFSIISDLQALVTQFEAGTLDLIKTPPLRDYVRLKADPHHQGIEHPTDGRYFLFGVNVTRPPLDNKQVRQALNWALDRERIVSSAILGVGVPKTLPWPTTSPAYDATKDSAFAFDLDKARSLLNGMTFSMDCALQSGNAELATAAQVYQSDLAQVGVTMNIQTMALAAWLDQVNNRKYNGVYASTDSRTALNPLTYYTSTPVFNPAINNEGYASTAYADLVTAAGSEADPVKQKQIYAQVNDLWLDESFVIPLSTASGTLVLRGGVQGLNHNMRAGWLFTNMWLEP